MKAFGKETPQVSYRNAIERRNEIIPADPVEDEEPE